MDKFNFHESLRIYLPGLLLTSVFYILFKNSLKDIQLILIPAVFVGLLLNGLIWKLHIPTFRKLTFKRFHQFGSTYTNYYESLDKIISLKISTLDSNKEFENILEGKKHKLLTAAEVSFFAKKFDSPEINCFRSPKSFGIMYFNLSVVCIFIKAYIIYCIFKEASFAIDKSHLSYLILIGFISLLSSFIFWRNSIHFFKRSLTRELDYWKSLSETETREYMEILKVISNLDNE